VRRRKADVGIALDGDADRLVVVDEQGSEVNGDAIIALCGTRMLRERRLKKRTVVTTIMSSLGLEHALQREGAKMLRVDVGDRYVVEAMRQGGYNFGGEQSGHLIFLDHATTGDGLVAALQVLAIMLREQRPLSEIVHEAIEPVPQVLVNVKLSQKRPLEELPKTRDSIRQAESELDGDGRVLVRWSGTEPKLRVMVEGPNERTIKRMAQDIAKVAEAEVG
jgi:phosphoglucosamine mutase